MPSQNRQPKDSSSEINAVEKHTPKTIDGCNTCPPAKSCQGAEITIETSGCLDGGGSVNLSQQVDEVIPLHVECPGDGKLSITTGESLEGGGEFTANQKCNTDIELGLNNAWLDRFVLGRIGNGRLNIEGDYSIAGGGEFTANQQNDTNIVLKVNWDQMPINGQSLEWQNGMLKVKVVGDLEARIAYLEAKVGYLDNEVNILKSKV